MTHTDDSLCYVSSTQIYEASFIKKLNWDQDDHQKGMKMKILSDEMKNHKRESRKGKLKRKMKRKHVPVGRCGNFYTAQLKYYYIKCSISSY